MRKVEKASKEEGIRQTHTKMRAMAQLWKKGEEGSKKRLQKWRKGKVGTQEEGAYNRRKEEGIRHV